MIWQITFFIRLFFNVIIYSKYQFLGLWESMHNPNFKGVEFDSFRKEAGTNAFTLSPQKWIEKTNV